MIEKLKYILLSLVLVAGVLGADSSVQAVSQQQRNDAANVDDGFVIIICQGYFKDSSGVNVYIPSGIPSKWFQSASEYHAMINAGVQHAFPNASRATIFTDQDGSAVKRQIAVRDRFYRTWNWQPAPKPKASPTFEPRLDHETAFLSAPIDDVASVGGPARAYAKPMAWGNWTPVATHHGRVTFGLRIVPDGDANIIAEVRYAADDGWEIAPFVNDSVTITTGDAIAQVYVRAKGLTTGTWTNVYVR